jgi:Txe/YoeB family toxin of Txe-Axe toxin-antitoxin module
MDRARSQQGTGIIKPSKMFNDPYGVGKPEPLKRDFAGCWSGGLMESIVWSIK